MNTIIKREMEIERHKMNMYDDRNDLERDLERVITQLTDSIKYFYMQKK